LTVDNSRSVAAHVLTLVVGSGKSLDRVLAKAFESYSDTRDRAFIQELVYGVLRRYWTLQPQLQHLLRRPLRDRDRSLEMLLLVGLYQIQYLSTPPYAAVAATVDACVDFKKPWAKGLVNGTLRNAIRKSDQLAKLVLESPSADTAHPEWFVREIRKQWPNNWQNMLSANNEHPPLTLRVNQQRLSRESYLQKLGEQGIDAQATRHSEQGIRLISPLNVADLPDFDAGCVSVQDEAAQLANEVLEIPECGRILDACAAPGGKTAHILEASESRLEVVAIDESRERMGLLEQSMQRLGLKLVTHVADAAALGDWWDNSPFDRILLDAPCSGSGVIRRHPDIKLHRRASDIENLRVRQRRLLDALWPLIKPGGKLVYATCSIFKGENDKVLEEFVEANDSAKVDRIAADWGSSSDFGRQIITGEEDMDGFYYARLIKR
jgi:16S rRNA (cytosine967-C5)-methyltransferase